MLTDYTNVMAVLGGLRDEFVEPCGAVEHRELGVHVEVRKRVAHSTNFLSC